MMDLFTRELGDLIQARVRNQVPMAEITSFGIGGPADMLVEAETVEQMVLSVNWAHALGIPWVVIGGGTNVLVSDEGVRGVVVRNLASGIEVQGTSLVAESGAKTDEVVRTAIQAGLAGLEFLAGIPGTIGGAVAGNAGCFGKAIGELLDWALVLEPGGMPERQRQGWFEFDYRSSVVQELPAIILQVAFGLVHGDRTELEAIAAKNLVFRKDRHPWDLPCAGSYFKNLPPPSPGSQRVPAGLLLEQSECHGLSVGDAAVFAKHANMIVNKGNATARDVLELAEQMRQKVKTKFDVSLEPEVRFLGKKPRIKKTV